jgi:hypothetical protein
MGNDEIKPPETQDTVCEKKDYKRPALTPLGHVTELTQSGSQTPSESNPHQGPSYRA